MNNTDQNPSGQASQDQEGLSFVISAAEAGTWDWDIASGELRWSELNRQMFGIPPGTKMTYELFLQALHPDDRERIDQAVKNTLEKGEKYDVEMRAVWPDGSIHWNASRGKAYFDESGRPVRYTARMPDVDQFDDFSPPSTNW